MTTNVIGRWSEVEKKLTDHSLTTLEMLAEPNDRSGVVPLRGDPFARVDPTGGGRVQTPRTFSKVRSWFVTRVRRAMPGRVVERAPNRLWFMLKSPSSRRSS